MLVVPLGSGVIGSTGRFGRSGGLGSNPPSPVESVRIVREHVFVPRGPSYTEEEARAAIAASLSFAEALRRLGKCPTGGASKSLRKWTVTWGISTDHFDQYAASRGRATRRRRPLEEILTENSTFARNHLKERLYDASLKRPVCELCGQDELWRGRPMGLILDHINGVSNDNRIENLRIVCPNCAATLDTHCGRKLRLPPRECALCGAAFQPKYAEHRYCSTWCGQRHARPHLRGPRPQARKVERPPYEQLVEEIQTMGYCTVGRKHGVSDNAIRKWVRAYEAELERGA
jgi:hypothetical protein